VLVLEPGSDGRLGYSLTTANGSTLDLSGLRPTRAQAAALDAAVADLASPRGSDAAEALSTRAVRYVALRRTPATSAYEAVLDAQPGLVRRTRATTVELWQVVAPSARLMLLSGDVADRALAGDRGPSTDLLVANPPEALPAGVEGANTTVPKGPSGRVVVLADAVDRHWQATLNGKRLPKHTAWGWAQGFVLPADGGVLRVHYVQTSRHAGLIVQTVLVLLVAVLSAPGARRRRGLEDDVDTDDEPEPAELHGPAVTA
jgi:hypothetical protein